MSTGDRRFRDRCATLSGDDAARRPDRARFGGQNHPVPAPDASFRHGRPGSRSGRRDHGARARARCPARPSDRDVLAAQAHAGHGDLRRHGFPTGRRRGRTRRRHALPHRRRAAPRRARLPGRRGAASGGIDRAGSRRQDHGGRADPGRPRGGRAAHRADREGPAQGGVEGRRNGDRRAAALRRRARSRHAAAGAGARPDGYEATPRLSVSLCQATASRHQRRRSGRGHLDRGCGTDRRPRRIPAGTRGPGADRLRQDRTGDRGAGTGRRGRFPGRPRSARERARPRDPRGLRAARLSVLLHRRRGRVPRLVDPGGYRSPGRGRRDPLGSGPRFHPCRGRRLRTPRGPRSLAACRKHAEMRLEGKDYVVRDGDVINVRFAT